MIRAMIVDDHTLFAEAVGGALAERGYRVEKVVRTGREAVEAARKIRPDLVIMDLQLPDGNGVDVGRAIVEQVPSTKVLAVTGDRDPELVWRSMRAGFHGFVTKESSMSTLVESLDAVLSGRTVTPRGWRESGPEEEGWSRPSSEPLTPREQEILRLLARGARTRQIAGMLHIATNTVRSHVQALLSKLGAHSRLEAVAIARRRGLLVDLDDATIG